MATYAVGDVQGCYDQLSCVLGQVNFNRRKDTLWLAGDLVNRGPQSLEVLRFAKSLGKRARVVLGNHDLHLLGVAHGVREARPKDSFRHILKARDRDELLNWLCRQPLLHSDTDLGYTMVHAGIPPIWSPGKAGRLAREVEATLQSNQCKRFLRSMYGNSPLCWKKSLSGMSRLRIITNYLTRMRFCTRDGTLDLEDRDKKTSSRPGFKPWFSHENPALKKQHILFGHWAALEGETNKKNIHALDTGCVWGAQLTLIRLDNRVRYTCDCRESFAKAS